MALSKSSLNSLKKSVQALRKRGIDISLKGSVATVKDPSGEFLAKYDFGEGHAWSADELGVSTLMTSAWAVYVTRICKPDHKGVDDYEAEWTVKSCEITGMALYDYKQNTYNYEWMIGEGAMSLRREQSFDDWPAPSQLRMCQGELVQSFQKLKPVFDSLQKQGVQPVCDDMQLNVGNVVVFCRGNKLWVDIFPPEESIEEPAGLAALCEGIVVLTQLKEYVTPEARERLKVEKENPPMKSVLEELE